MKIIVSHDVDHLFWREHWLRDAFIPKHLLRSSWQLCHGKIDLGLWWQRMSAPFKGGTLHNLKELVSFDREHAIPATYFVGVSQGLGMSYGVREATQLVAWLLGQGVEVGVHGIVYQDAAAIGEEYSAFKRLLPAETTFGVRNHYLQRNEATLSLQASAGYLFDSSEEAVLSPYCQNSIWEFPVCLMDSRVIQEGLQNLEIAKMQTERSIIEAETLGISHFTVIFHDVYFSTLFPAHMEWYKWVIPWLAQRFEFTDFEGGIADLSSGGGG